jgi:hypothetical protein
MRLRQSIALAALGFAAIAPTFARAADIDTAAGCVFQGRQVESVQPFKENIRVGRITYKHLAGATVNLKAEPGVSVEWLRVEIGQRQRACGADDRLTTVVDRRPAGYAVTMKGPPTSTGHATTSMGHSILQQAKGLL